MERVVSKSKLKVLGVIPARFKSSRFEGKPLALIDGIPMLVRTYQQALKSNLLHEVVVATEDDRIFSFCNSMNIPVLITSDKCLTGTDRLVEVSKELEYDFYINIQGDEPVIDPECISQIINLYLTNSEYDVYNLYKVISDQKEINSNTIIKVIVNEMDEMMYMSRLPIPYSNSELQSTFKQQIPVYGFTRNALERFSGSKKTINEQFEDIELLRFVDTGMKVKMAETTVDSISVDVPSDIQKVELFLRNKKKATN